MMRKVLTAWTSFLNLEHDVIRSYVYLIHKRANERQAKQQKEYNESWTAACRDSDLTENDSDVRDSKLEQSGLLSATDLVCQLRNRLCGYSNAGVFNDCCRLPLTFCSPDDF